MRSQSNAWMSHDGSGARSGAAAGGPDAMASAWRCTLSTLRCQPLPKVGHVERPSRKCRRRSQAILMAHAGSARPAAASVLGPTTPSAATPSAACSHFAPREGPLFTAASNATRSSPAGRSSHRTAGERAFAPQHRLFKFCFFFFVSLVKNDASSYLVPAHGRLA